MILQADDLRLYLASDVWQAIDPGQQKLLVAVSGFGRFWVHLVPPPAAGERPTN